MEDNLWWKMTFDGDAWCTDTDNKGGRVNMGEVVIMEIDESQPIAIFPTNEDIIVQESSHIRFWGCLNQFY